MKIRHIIIITLTCALCIIAICFPCCTKLVKISDSSMYPTLQDGDILLTWKTHKNSAKNIRGRIIVFYFPFGEYDDRIHASRNNIYVKRCTGVPGDTVFFKTNDNTDQNRPHLKYYDWICDRPVIVPYKGYRIPLNDSTTSLYRKLILYETDDWNYCNNIDKTYYTFQGNYFFAIGDNQSSSYDSRHWGFIPESFIISYQ